MPPATLNEPSAGGIKTSARLSLGLGGRFHSQNSQIKVRPRFFNPRSSSLLRGSALVLLSLGVALRLSDFPRNHATPLLILPALTSAVGTAETLRCMKPRWSFYHGGVLLLVYMDLMAFCMILFFLLYPYAGWITSK
jgi:hypothetical protein